MAHPQTNFSSNFQGVDPPLEGYWHDDPIPCGGGNVVTDIWPNPAGVPVVVKGFNALTDEDIADKLDKTGDASNTASTFTKASGDASTMTSGSKLYAIFTAISSFFASVASALNGKQDSLGISSSGDTGKFLNERGVFATPNYPSVPSVINNLTSDSTTDALSAAQGKELNYWKASNTLSNVYGIRPSTLNISGLTGNTWYNIFDISIGTYASIPIAIKIQGRNLGLFKLFIRWPHSESTTPTQFSIDSPNYTDVGYTVDPNNSRLFHIWLKTPGGLNVLSAVYEAIGNGAAPAVADGTMTATGTEPTNLVRPSYSYPIVERGGKGSQTTPVYVDSNGQVQPCDVLSGGTSNFNRTFTTSYTVGSTDQYITTAIKNDSIDLIADYVTWHNANVGKLSSPPMIIISVSTRDTVVANAGLITLNMYKTGNGCDVFGEKYAYMGNQHGSEAYNTQYLTDQTFVSGSAYYLNIRNETPNTMWAAGIILDISIRIVAHAVSVT